jgi:cell fate regulator YaaT (PSP1 superfamily)
LGAFDWLAGMETSTLRKGKLPAEVRFKNTRKEFYNYAPDFEPQAGDVVVVECGSGYDMGQITLTGETAVFQVERKGAAGTKKFPSILRKATEKDLETWSKSRDLEKKALPETRKLIDTHKLDMKLSDVEYQADGSKATFYYTAEGRIDFRELIKDMAGAFRTRIEMRQIGARQEAGLVGGIGSCGRELCCSTWLTDFRTVSTSAARYQQLSINPLKLAGQCGKLKCCLNYELDSYLDALRDFPEGNVQLRTKKGIAYLQKTDIFKRMMWFSLADNPSVFIPLSTNRVNEILALNKQGKFPEEIIAEDLYRGEETMPDYQNVVGQDDVRRFDQAGGQKRKKKKKKPRKNKGAER